MKLRIIALDADDTLWHNMQLFMTVETRFQEMLADHGEPEEIAGRLFETETRNLEHFGYGVKGFTLSMIETAIELSDGAVTAREIAAIVEMGREMVHSPIELLDFVEPTIRRLASSHELMLLSKGDLFDQESKLARSGLGDYFRHVEIVSRKTPEVYADVLRRYDLAPEQFVMVGDSLRSDVLPVLEIGARAIHVPFPIIWAHEEVAEESLRGLDFDVVAHLGELPAAIARIEAA